MNAMMLLHLAEQIEAEGCQSCNSLDYQAELRAAAHLLRLAASHQHVLPLDANLSPPATDHPTTDESFR